MSKITTSTNRSALNETNEGWPVRVFRKTEHHGWQKMRPKNSQGRTVILKATPRHGCIALHRIQVRVRLSLSCDGDNVKNNEEKSPYTNVESKALPELDQGSNKTKKFLRNDVLVVRRRQSLLISSRLRLRSLVFQFFDVKSCLAFSDRLLELNPNPNLFANTSRISHPKSTPFSHQKNLETFGKRLPGNHDMTNRSNVVTPNSNDIENQQVLSLIGRLLHDEDFATLCSNLESCISASEDGLQMLNTLTFHDNTSIPIEHT
jgi:hypothetical protein